jgi:hypothetical protein
MRPVALRPIPADDGAMDLMKWLSSLDELLYEVMSWIVFFPLTLWRAVRRPLAMMDYAERQLALPPEAQYADAVSPPLFLALALVLAHATASALGEVDVLIANRHGLAGMVTDNTSALLVRLVIFAAFPLAMSVRLVRRLRLPLDRTALRNPFYAQCYPAAAFALALSMGATIAGAAGAGTAATVGGGLLIVVAPVFYLVVQTRWFGARLGLGPVRAFAAAALGLLEGFALLLLAGYLLGR